eukprot:scaffold72164_cov27-Tisochrysis_lutea.AAC.1
MRKDTLIHVRTGMSAFDSQIPRCHPPTCAVRCGAVALLQPSCLARGGATARASSGYTGRACARSAAGARLEGCKGGGPCSCLKRCLARRWSWWLSWGIYPRHAKVRGVQQGCLACNINSAGALWTCRVGAGWRRSPLPGPAAEGIGRTFISNQKTSMPG